MQFTIKKINKKYVAEEIKKIGFEKSYIHSGIQKHKFLNLKIYALTPKQATILKQTALSADCDCAVSRGVLDCSVEKTDCVLSGSIAQIKETAKKLKKQPFSLSELGEELSGEVEKLNHDSRPVVMGILNLSKDSFSNDFKDPLKRTKEIIKQGAGIIDIGAESTKPNARAVSDEEQLEKILPILDFLKDKKILKSVDTRSSVVAKECCKMGADIINDVSFLNHDEKLLNVAMEYDKKLVLTHSRGTPETMDGLCNYGDVVNEVYLEIFDKVKQVLCQGFNPDNLIIDVGLGFAKNVGQNLEIMKHIDEFRSFGCKLMVGVSRKRTLQYFSHNKNNDDLDFLTALSTFYFTFAGVDIIRVHNIKLSAKALDFARALKQ